MYVILGAVFQAIVLASFHEGDIEVVTTNDVLYANEMYETMLVSSQNRIEPATDGYAYVCRGALGYKTPLFVQQAEAASSQFLSVRVDGYPVIVLWDTVVDLNQENYDWTVGDNFQDTHAKNELMARNIVDPDNTHCIVAFETDGSYGPNQGNILGTARTCGACDKTYGRNTAFIAQGMDDSLTFAVILHEFIHLFCGNHGSGVMRPYITTDDDFVLISSATQNEIAPKIRQDNCIELLQLNSTSDYTDLATRERGDGKSASFLAAALGSLGGIGIFFIVNSQ